MVGERNLNFYFFFLFFFINQLHIIKEKIPKLRQKLKSSKKQPQTWKCTAGCGVEEGSEKDEDSSETMAHSRASASTPRTLLSHLFPRES